MKEIITVILSGFLFTGFFGLERVSNWIPFSELMNKAYAFIFVGSGIAALIILKQFNFYNRIKL